MWGGVLTDNADAEVLSFLSTYLDQSWLAPRVQRRRPAVHDGRQHWRRDYVTECDATVVVGRGDGRWSVSCPVGGCVTGRPATLEGEGCLTVRLV